MTTKQVKRELLEWNGRRPFISLTEICKAMHVGKDRARAIVTGLDYFRNGKRKDFLVEDVARRIAENATILNGDSARLCAVSGGAAENIEKHAGDEGCYEQ